MKDNKTIERLFQEKLKDFEKDAPDVSWEIIASQLNKKEKKRKVLPFWFTFSNIAAGLLLIGFIGWNAFKTNSEAIFIHNEKTSTIQHLETQDNSNTISDAEQELKNTLKSDINLVADEKENKIGIEKENAFKNNSSKEPITKEDAVKERLVKNNTRIVIKNKNQAKSTNRADLQEDMISKKDFTNKFLKNSDVVASNLGKNNNGKTSKINDFDSTFLQKNTNTDIVNVLRNDIDITEKKLNELTFNEDSLLIIASLEEEAKNANPLEKLLKEKEEGKNADEKENQNKWAINSQVSPVYFNSLSEGSSIDNQFLQNGKSYSNSLSFGLGITYELSKKISLRSGINTVGFSYNTNDVFYESAMKGTQVTNNVPNIARNSNSERIMLMSKTATSEINLLSDVDEFFQKGEGSLRQDFSYIEIPLELSYKLVDKKFGVAVIGGMSTLFLNNNSISLVTDGMEMEIGKARNLNDIHFSSNVGLGFKYTFWKSFNANFQPMFKYQINPFSENAGNFKPYFIGLYSGISYQF